MICTSERSEQSEHWARSGYVCIFSIHSINPPHSLFSYLVGGEHGRCSIRTHTHTSQYAISPNGECSRRCRHEPHFALRKMFVRFVFFFFFFIHLFLSGVQRSHCVCRITTQHQRQVYVLHLNIIGSFYSFFFSLFVALFRSTQMQTHRALTVCAAEAEYLYTHDESTETRGKWNNLYCGRCRWRCCCCWTHCVYRFYSLQKKKYFIFFVLFLLLFCGRLF